MKSRWIRGRPGRRRGPEPPAEVPPLSPADVVLAVRAEQAARPPEWCLDDMELVQVAAGAWPGERRDAGVRMTWHQGPSRFGLLISWHRLVRRSCSSAAVPSYLDLAIDEPHAAGLDSTVLWFLDLPSGLH